MQLVSKLVIRAFRKDALLGLAILKVYIPNYICALLEVTSC
jgi:hypothetical protein